MFKCAILADSISDRAHRLTTFEITFPRFLLAEVNTHRMLSRNSASSRAIPVHKSIKAIATDPFIPASFGKNKAGMSAAENLTDVETYKALQAWQHATDDAVHWAKTLGDLEVHKSLANRILEPFKWHTAIVSGTDWSNFFALRIDPTAQPEFQTIAQMMREAYLLSTPNHIGGESGEYHLPLVTEEEIMVESLMYPEPWVDWERWAKVSIGRCARVSYLTHDGIRDPKADVDLHNMLMTNGHLSPFEHVARPFDSLEWQFIDKVRWDIQFNEHYSRRLPDLADRVAQQIEYCGNFHGWYQKRYDVPHQQDFSIIKGQRALHS